MNNKRPVAFFLGMVLSCAAATAAPTPVIDQEQAGTSAAGTLAIGWASQQKLAQTVTARIDGFLSHIELPVACASGELIVEIVELEGDLPTGRVRGSAVIGPGMLPPPAESPFPFVRIALGVPVRIARGDRLGIVLRNETGVCGLALPSGGDTYGGGEYFFDSRPNPAGVWVAGPYDLPFRTVVDVGSTGHETQCEVRGLSDPLPIPKFVPVCRCLQDAQLREQRCTLLHPSLILFRRLPFPLKANEPFTVRWTLMPLASLGGIVEVADHLPAGFDSSLKTPLWFFADRTMPGETLTLEYSAVASGTGGAFHLNTGVSIPGAEQTRANGSMRTLVSVLPPQ
jgi:hypothetical protein